MQENLFAFSKKLQLSPQNSRELGTEHPLHFHCHGRPANSPPIAWALENFLAITGDGDTTYIAWRRALLQIHRMRKGGLRAPNNRVQHMCSNINPVFHILKMISAVPKTGNPLKLPRISVENATDNRFIRTQRRGLLEGKKTRLLFVDLTDANQPPSNPCTNLASELFRSVPPFASSEAFCSSSI